MEADLTSHHIEGYAAMGEGQPHFSVSLVSHITGNLWTGGVLHGVRLSDDFEYVLSLYPFEKYKLGPHTKRWEHPLSDGDRVPPREMLITLAAMAGQAVNKGKTLVHCQAGLNRSALIAGLMLVRTGDWTADQAIELMREVRSPVVLCNQFFERWLREYEP
jgi:protein-tyrosine phosphatase